MSDDQPHPLMRADLALAAQEVEALEQVTSAAADWRLRARHAEANGRDLVAATYRQCAEEVKYALAGQLHRVSPHEQARIHAAGDRP